MELEADIPVLAAAMREKIDTNEKFESAGSSVVSLEGGSEGVQEESQGEEGGGDTAKAVAAVVLPLPFVCKWDRELRIHLFDVLGECSNIMFYLYL